MNPAWMKSSPECSTFVASISRWHISLLTMTPMERLAAIGRTHGVKRVAVPRFGSITVALEPRSLGSLPAPAESVVELDQREPLVQLRLRKIELRGEFVAFTGEYLQVTRAAMLVKYFREAIGILCRRRQ
jgi:hypothetical protein